MAFGLALLGPTALAGPARARAVRPAAATATEQRTRRERITETSTKSAGTLEKFDRAGAGCVFSARNQETTSSRGSRLSRHLCEPRSGGRQHRVLLRKASAAGHGSRPSTSPEEGPRKPQRAAAYPVVTTSVW